MATSARNPSTIHSLVEFDESQFPLVCVRVTGSLSEDEFQTFLDGLDRIRAAAKERYAVMFDLREMRMPSGRQVRMSADWLRARAGEIRETTIANAFVVGSSAVHVALTAVFRLQASVIPYAVVETMEEARVVLQRYLDREKTVA